MFTYDFFPQETRHLPNTITKIPLLSIIGPLESYVDGEHPVYILLYPLHIYSSSVSGRLHRSLIYATHLTQSPRGIDFPNRKREPIRLSQHQ